MEELAGNWYILVYNLDTQRSPCQLGKGITIRHLTRPLSVFDLAAAGASGFREWAVLEPFLPGCRCEIETMSDAATLPGYDTLNRAWLASALLKLKGYYSHLPLACSCYSWSVVAEQSEKRQAEKHDLPCFKGQLLECYTKYLSIPNTKIVISEQDADWINSNFERFNVLASKSDSFRFALSAAVEWQYSTEPRAAVARLWSGIEALFGIESELIYRISLVISCLLEPRGTTRRERFAKIRKLYGVRSKAVHGAKLSEQEITEAMIETSEILNKLLLINLEKGRTFSADDLEEAVLL